MVDFFDKLYYISNRENIKALKKFRLYSLMRFIIRGISNAIIPVYFRLSQRFLSNGLSGENPDNGKFIVSLTSFPARIDKLWIVIESIFRQSRKPDKIILWLSKDQFPSGKVLPKKLLEQTKRGLEIVFVDGDIRSYKKYYYAMQEYPEDIIITIDDDVIYNSCLLKNLITSFKNDESCIHCNQAHEIGFQNNDLMSYNNWKNLSNPVFSSGNIMAVGIGGILYPPNVLYDDAFNLELIKNLCPLADDVWLNTMAKLKNTKITKTGFNSSYLPILNKFDKRLYTENVLSGKNDIQINNIRNYYKKSIGIDPYLIKN